MSAVAKRAMAALGVTALAVAYSVSSGGDDGYTVRAELANAGGLRPNSSVKINGVPAGEVRELEITDRDTALATLVIDEGAAPLGEGVQLNVRPTDLLGERYAELKGGDRSKPLAAGTTIPTRDTAVPVELDDVLNTLDIDTRTRLGILINEAGVALTGRGADFNALLAELPPALEDTDLLLEQVEAENAAIRRGVVAADRVTSAVNARREDLGDLVEQASDSLEVVAQRRRELGATVRSAPGALAQLRTTLATLDRASLRLRPTAKAIEATAAPLEKTLEQLPDFTEAAKPALEKLSEVSPTLTRLATEARPTLEALEPTVRNVERALDESAPILKHLDRRGWDDFLFFVNNMNLGLRGRDGIGHFIGAKLVIATEYIDNAVENFTNLEPAATKKREKAPRVETLPRPGGDAVGKEPTRPLDELQKATDRVDALLKDVTTKVGETVTGATEQVVPKLGEQTGKALEGVTKGVRGLNGLGRGTAPKGGSADGDTDALRLFNYLMGR